MKKAMKNQNAWYDDELLCKSVNFQMTRHAELADDVWHIVCSLQILPICKCMQNADCGESRRDFLVAFAVTAANNPLCHTETDWWLTQPTWNCFEQNRTDVNRSRTFIIIIYCVQNCECSCYCVQALSQRNKRQLQSNMMLSHSTAAMRLLCSSGVVKNELSRKRKKGCETRKQFIPL